MKENKNILSKSTSFYGLLLGGFWTVKYIFFILGSRYSAAVFVYWMLSPLTLLFAYYMTKTYKIMIGGKIGFFHAWQFGFLLYFFAALIVSLPHFIFYRYLAPPEFIASSMEQAVSIMKNMDLNESMKQVIDQMATPTPIQMAVQGILNNILYGAILSIPIAALLCRNNITGTIHSDNQKEDDS